jgi:hypothetical protein
VHLQLRQEVRRLAEVEGARSDEEDVVGVDVAVLGSDDGALQQGKEVALHALGRSVGGATVLCARGGEFFFREGGFVLGTTEPSSKGSRLRCTASEKA